MKYLIFSDVHGSNAAIERILNVFEEKQCDHMIILGDVLYHGPRNDLPEGYAPKEVIEKLNAYAEKITCVRGNCEAEVDQMVLEFSCLSESALIVEEGVVMYATHGHRFNPKELPSYAKKDLFLYGHTHLWEIEKVDNTLRCNPGSISIPKGGNDATYALYEEGTISVFDFEGECLKKMNI